MPYVTPERKFQLDRKVGPHYDSPNCGGDLNYFFTLIVLNEDPQHHDELIRGEIDAYLVRKGLRYQFCNDAMGALVGAKSEARRRLKSRKFDALFDRVHDKFYDEVVGPYEKTCIIKNGDVYPAGTPND